VTKSLMVSLFVPLLSIALLGGCGSSVGGPKTVSAKGKVTLDGAPVENAQVIFIDDANQFPAYSPTDSSGNFSLRLSEEKMGAVPGTYKVQVSKTLLGGSGSEDGGAEVTLSYGLPKKYANFMTSNLTYTIPDGGATDIKLELSSK
jgi:hypothetical protein